jgi:GntR family transcriptional regulator, vanillate catabolism transcriptional regulator
MSTQTQVVTAKVRHMLVCGEYAAGEKLREHVLAQQLEVSRTPVRLALSELEREGLLEYSPNRGFVAKAFTIDHVLNAVDVRERLEGMAAGILALKGATDTEIRTLESCLLQTEGLLARPSLGERDISTWSDVNGTFHETLVQAANNDVLSEALGRISLVPMASPRSFTGMFLEPDGHREAIAVAHLAHRWVFEAVVERDGARAETMMRQHIHESRSRLRKVLEDRMNPRVAGDPRFRLVVDSSSAGHQSARARPPQ